MSSIPTIGGGPSFFPGDAAGPDEGTLEVRVRDRGLARVLPELIADGRLSKADAEAMVRACEDGPGLANTERRDLVTILQQGGGRIDAEARALLERYLGIAPGGTEGTGRPDASRTGATDGTTARTPADIWSSLTAAAEPGLDPTGTRRPVALGANHRFTATPGTSAESPSEVGRGLFAAATLIDDTRENLFDRMDLDAGGQRGVFTALSRDLASVEPGAPPPGGLSDTQALQLRSSGATVLLELLSARTTDPALRREAFALYTRMAADETNPLLKDGMVFNLDRLRGALPAELHRGIDDLMEVIKPHQPPYDEWFKDGNDTVKVEWVNGDSECKEISLHQLEKDGFEVVSQSWNETVLAKEIEHGGVTTKFEVHMRQNRGDMYREVEDDGDSHLVLYTGHSNWGRNMRTALSGAETGERGGAGKLVMTDLCVGKGEIQMFRDRFPNAHLVTTYNSSYYSTSSKRSEGDAAFRTMIRDIAARRGYEAMAENVRKANPWAWSHSRDGVDNNFIFPSDLKTRRIVLDRDHDGQSDVFDRLVSFDTFAVEEDTAREFQPIDAARPAEELVGTKLHFAAQTVNRLSVYSELFEETNSTGRVVHGGYFEPGPGDQSLFRFETREVDGDELIEMRMSSRYAHMSEEAVRMAACFEFNRYMAANDRSWPLDEQGTVLNGLVMASHSLDTDAGYRDRQVWREFLSAYNLPDVPRSEVEGAKEADDHYYSGSRASVRQLERELDPEVLAALTAPGAGELARP